jgi:APA family basic amino acid/polyamine antiporter
VALTAVGAMHWTEFTPETEASLALVLERVTGASWPSALLSFGAVIAIASVVLSVMYGQTRILFAMSRDGLIPRAFQKISGGRQVPVANTLIVAAFVALLAAFVPLERLTDLTSMGTLFAFGLVSIGVIALRRKRPDLPRSFHTPLYPLTPILGVLGCAYLIFYLGLEAQLTFLTWTVLGLFIYFLYGYRRSRLALRTPPTPPTPHARRR